MLPGDTPNHPAISRGTSIGYRSRGARHCRRLLDAATVLFSWSAARKEHGRRANPRSLRNGTGDGWSLNCSVSRQPSLCHRSSRVGSNDAAALILFLPQLARSKRGDPPPIVSPLGCLGRPGTCVTRDDLSVIVSSRKQPAPYHRSVPPTSGCPPRTGPHRNGNFTKLEDARAVVATIVDRK